MASDTLSPTDEEKQSARDAEIGIRSMAFKTIEIFLTYAINHAGESLAWKAEQRKKLKELFSLKEDEEIPLLGANLVIKKGDEVKKWMFIIKEYEPDYNSVEELSNFIEFFDQDVHKKQVVHLISSIFTLISSTYNQFMTKNADFVSEIMLSYPSDYDNMIMTLGLTEQKTLFAVEEWPVRAGIGIERIGIDTSETL